MNYFKIITNKETALEIELFFKSDVLATSRSLELGEINHYQGYSDVQIKSSKQNGLIEPTDIFWMGYYSASLFSK